MKKFKCIKTYPVAEKDDIVQFQEGAFPAYFNIKSGKRYVKNEIEDYPEYWEKVVDKEYEILSFSDSYNICSKVNGKFTINTAYYYTEEELLNDKTYHHWKINSVKRLSDGEVFTIGDKVKSSIGGNIGQITKFNINDHKYSEVLFGDYYGQKLNNIEKVEQPLFTTEDGVDIYNRDSYWYIVISDNILTDPWKPKQHIANWKRSNLDINQPPLGKVQFSNKEAAEKYILYNKPLLSLNEISNKLDYLYDLNLPFRTIKDELTELTKKKLNK